MISRDQEILNALRVPVQEQTAPFTQEFLLGINEQLRERMNYLRATKEEFHEALVKLRCSFESGKDGTHYAFRYSRPMRGLRSRELKSW